MATNITTSFNSIYLTAQLPETVFIGTSESSVTVRVEVDGDEVFKSVYYPYNQVIAFRDLRSIVEAAMLDQGLDIATLEIWAEPPSGNASAVQDVKVIYSDRKFVSETEALLRAQFLTTRTSALIPKDGHVILCNYTKAFEEGYNNITIYYSMPYAADTVLIKNHYMGRVQSETAKIVSVKLDYAYFKTIVDNATGGNAVIRGAEYHIGGRRFNIFFTDEQPTDNFEFLNCFGEQETLYLYGATTIKSEVDRSEAVSGRKTQYYDETVKVKHEVETAPLTFEEAKWVSQMLTSKWVAKHLAEGIAEEILISDITSEVTDSDKELTRIKFSWKYAKGTEWG